MALTELHPFIYHLLTISGYLKQHGALRFTPPICTELGCNREMSWIRDSGSSDGWMWRSPCHRRKRACRKGSYFYESNLSLRKLVQLLFCWCHRMPNYAAGIFNIIYLVLVGTRASNHCRLLSFCAFS